MSIALVFIIVGVLLTHWVRRPDWGLLAVALWTGACLVLHGLQLLQAWVAWRRDGTLVSWMAQG